MTNKKAMRLIRNLPTMCEFTDAYGEPIDSDAYYEAVDMAISALQAQEAKAQLSAEGTTNLQPTCNNLEADTISRQAAIDVCDNAIDLWHGQLGEGIVIAVKKKIEELPSAQPEIEERTEEFAQNVPKEDLISRKAAIDALDCINGVEEVLRALPSAQPEPLVKESRTLVKNLVKDTISRQVAIDALWEIRQEEISDGRRFHDHCSLSTAVDVIKDLPSAQPEWNNHTVACLLAELFDDTCACNYNGIDEWLPSKCELLDSCPNPVGVACWEQYLKHRAERRTDAD